MYCLKPSLTSKFRLGAAIFFSNNYTKTRQIWTPSRIVLYTMGCTRVRCPIWQSWGDEDMDQGLWSLYITHLLLVVNIMPSMKRVASVDGKLRRKLFGCPISPQSHKQIILEIWVKVKSCYARHIFPSWWIKLAPILHWPHDQCIHQDL